MRQVPHWLDGQEHQLGGARTSPVFDPATGRQTAEVVLAEVDDVDAAVKSARAAYAGWSTTSLTRRTAVLFRFRQLLADNADRLAAIITSEHGKTLPDAAGEIARGLENVEFACAGPQVLKGEFSEQVSTGIDVFSIRQPLGVAVGITPFNFPAMVPLWMMANALIAGNAFVLKPSEKVPSASMAIAGLLAEAGLPPGVLTVLHGDRVAVDRLLEHPDVDAISFVGSTPIARHVYETGTANGKRVQALGGAKNHMVVLPDADLDVAADAAISAGYGSAGERCMAISVVVAVGDVADPLVAAISERIPGVVVAEGTTTGADMGPLITREHRDRVESYVAGARDEGATVVVDGRDAAVPSGGFFLAPTLLDHVERGMAAYEDEIFGPVLSVVRVASYDEALALVNENPYANGGAIFTRSGAAARRFQTEADVGMLGVNVPVPVPVGSFSFGGRRSSLFGDTHMYGPDGIRFFTRTKVVTSRWPDGGGRTGRIDLGFPGTS